MFGALLLLLLQLGCSQPIVGTDASVACVTDLDCSLGSFCGAAGGCTTECLIDSDCLITHEPGSTCDARGRCSGDARVDAGASDAGVDAARLDAGPAFMDGSSDSGPRDSGTDTGARLDGGVDAGWDPCFGVTSCTAPTPYCLGGGCVACASPSDCGGPTPICDRASGLCVAPETGNPVCAPCNNDFDCGGAAICVTLFGYYSAERVCFPSSVPSCPLGMV